jgi:hypothetical protein
MGVAKMNLAPGPGSRPMAPGPNSGHSRGVRWHPTAGAALLAARIDVSRARGHFKGVGGRTLHPQRTLSSMTLCIGARSLLMEYPLDTPRNLAVIHLPLELCALRLQDENPEKESAMKRLFTILALFILGPCVAKNAAGGYTVHIPGSTTPYMCAACGLDHPIPDQKTLEVITAWKEGKAPFADSEGHRATRRSLEPGDFVSVCNTTGCTDYTLGRNGNWGMGTFAPFESHLGHPSSKDCPPNSKTANQRQQ